MNQAGEPAAPVKEAQSEEGTTDVQALTSSSVTVRTRVRFVRSRFTRAGGMRRSLERYRTTPCGAQFRALLLHVPLNNFVERFSAQVRHHRVGRRKTDRKEDVRPLVRGTLQDLVQEAHRAGRVG